MQWFHAKEQSAGNKRLFVSWILYRIFGKNILYVIAFFVSFFTFVFSKNVRSYSKKYLEVISKYTDITPSLINQFKHINSYANSLVDKILVYCGDFETNSIIFHDNASKENLLADIANNKGVVFLCSHVGNIEVMHSFFLNKSTYPKPGVNIFISKSQSRIFNSFLKKIKINYPVKLHMVDDIGLETGIELKENIEKGDVVFIAGDRVAENNSDKNIEMELFDKKVYLPKGAFKLAKILKTPVYFVSILKEKENYSIYLERNNSSDENSITTGYLEFLKRTVITSPLQFYNFYDFFN